MDVAVHSPLVRPWNCRETNTDLIRTMDAEEDFAQVTDEMTTNSLICHFNGMSHHWLRPVKTEYYGHRDIFYCENKFMVF